MELDDMENRDVELDPELWNRLPTELLQKVLAKLPLTSLLSFRAVSRQWKSMIEGPRLFYEGSPGKPVLFYFDPIPAGSGWSSPSLFFPDSGTNSWKREELPGFRLKRIVLVAANGGLLCFSSDRTADTFVIYNPLSRAWREVTLPSSVLPRLPRGSQFEDACTYILVGLAVNRETGVYNLLVAGIHEDCPRDTLLYNSSTKDWKRCASVPSFDTFRIAGEWIEGKKWCSERSLCCGGNLYWLVYELEYKYSDFNVKALLKYSMEKDEWAVAQELAPSQYSEFHIVSHDGNILLLDWWDRATFMVYMPLSEFQSVGSEIKQLSDEGYQGLIDAICGTNDGTHILVRFITEGDCFYTIYERYDNPEVEASSDFEESTHKVSTYNLRTSVLTWLPPIAYLSSTDRVWALAPSLRAFV